MSLSRIVCILGPPRCGTSLTTRMLNLLGVELGPEGHLLEADTVNAKGDWEHVPIRQLNDDLLAEHGGSWFDPPLLTGGWQNAAGLAPFREKAREIIRRDFADAAVWGWKDPRTCLTIPFWRDLLPSMHFVICLRDPVEMAQSLRRFIHCSLDHGLYLWLAYMQAAVEHTGDSKRIIVPFRDMFLRSQTMIDELARIAGTPVGKSHEAKIAASQFVDGRQWHNRDSIQSRSGVEECSPVVLAAARRAFDALQETEQTGWRAATDTLREAMETVTPLVAEDICKRRLYVEQWTKNVKAAAKDLAVVVDECHKIMLIDDNALKNDDLVAGRTIPFLERNGRYWGRPGDDAEAIAELERMRLSCAEFLVVAWPAFWWLDYYSGFSRYLRTNFKTVLENDYLIVFDLRKSGPAE